MKIKYKGKKYKISLKDTIIIKKEQFILIIKRIKRLIPRIQKSLEPLIVVIILSFIYLGMVYLVGRITNEYHTLKRVIWDSKELLFSSIIIVFAMDFSSKKRQRNNKLNHQRCEFEILVEQSDSFLEEVCKCIGINCTSSVVLSKDLNDKFKETIKKIKVPEKIILHENSHEIIKFSINNLKKEYIKIIKNIKKRKYEAMSNYDIWFYQELLNFCKEFETKLNYNISTTQLKDLIIDLSGKMYLSCLYIGRVWTWDYDSNQRIRTIILKYIDKNDNNYEHYEITRWF